MDLPIELFSSNLIEGTILKFHGDHLVGTSDPHHHIIVGFQNDDLVLMAICTSKKDKIERFIELQKLSLSTAVWINPSNKENFLNRDTFINCNNGCRLIPKSLLEHKFNAGKLSFSGSITENELLQIKQGIFDSRMTDEILKDIIRGSLKD